MESIKRFLTVSWPYLAAAAGAALLTVVFITLQKKDRPNQTVDSFLAPAPDFSLHSIDGEPIRSTDLRGKVIVINFWATWCPPCTYEIPHLNKLYRRYAEEGLEIIGFSLDRNGLRTVKNYVRENDIAYPIAMATAELVQDFGEIQGIPTSFLIDRKGKIVRKIVGYRSYEHFEKIVREVL